MIYVFLISHAGFYFLFFTSSVFFFSGFIKKKRKIYLGGREGEGERHKAKTFINSFGEKVYYLKNMGTDLWIGKILLIRSIDGVLGLLISNADFLFMSLSFFLFCRFYEERILGR